MARVLLSTLPHVWGRSDKHYEEGDIFHISQQRKKGKYNPVCGEFNFLIPSIPTLKKLDIGFPSEIQLGFLDQSLDFT